MQLAFPSPGKETSGRRLERCTGFKLQATRSVDVPGEETRCDYRAVPKFGVVSRAPSWRIACRASHLLREMEVQQIVLCRSCHLPLRLDNVVPRTFMLSVTTQMVVQWFELHEQAIGCVVNARLFIAVGYYLLVLPIFLCRDFCTCLTVITLTACITY